MRTSLSLGILLIAAAGGGVLVVLLHQQNAALRSQIEARATRLHKSVVPTPTAAQSRNEDRRAPAEKKIDAHLLQLRADVANLEKIAAHSANAEASDAPTTNRDPEKGMTRMEYMQNVGQATPAAAMQTLFWAAMKGDEAAMARTIVWDEAVRPKVQALIDRLPAASRERYATPELLAALFISRQALDVSAIHITETTMTDATHAGLMVKGLTGREEPLPMRLSALGWQYSIGEGRLAWLTGQLTGKPN